MKIIIKTNESECTRIVNNNEKLCQLIVDLHKYFLPKYSKISVSVEMNNKGHTFETLNEHNICELLAMIWNEWRFEDDRFIT